MPLGTLKIHLKFQLNRSYSYGHVIPFWSQLKLPQVPIGHLVAAKLPQIPPQGYITHYCKDILPILYSDTKSHILLVI